MWMDWRKRMAAGAAAAAMILGGLFCFGDGALSDNFFLYEALPLYRAETTGAAVSQDDEAVSAFAQGGGAVETPRPVGGLGGGVSVVGLDALLRQGEDAHDTPHDLGPLVSYGMDDLRELDFLTRNFYTIDPGTALLASDVDVDDFMARSMRLSDAPGPKVLIFHTHMYESFAGSDPDDPFGGVFGAGERLAQKLRAYGIETIHCAERFDVANGAINIQGAYERMEPVIQRILAENPTIEATIDIHRDGVPDDEKAVTAIDGQSAARIMFFNGMSRLKSGGAVKNVDSLPNPNLRANLAFSFQSQLAVERLFPGLAKKIYLKSYRYSLHLLPKSMLVEVGNQNNTAAEAAVAMDALGEALAWVLTGE